MMKKLIFFLFLFKLSSIDIFSQELKYPDLSSAIRPKGPFTSYLSKDGVVYNVGDKLKIGFPSSNKTFAFIMNGANSVGSTASNTEVEIKTIGIGGTKRTGFCVWILCKGFSGYSIQLENAIAVREVISSGMTSDEALSNMKRAKDKLDLG